MRADMIIWDFDGTLLPLAPYDSEHTLMLHKLGDTSPRPPYLVRAIARLLIKADRRQMLSNTFKQFYIRLMKGTPLNLLDQVSRRLSDSISTQDRQTIRHLNSENYRMMVLSCGTADLSESVLKMAGLGDCFESIAGNRFNIENGRINGMTLHIAEPADKVIWLTKMGISAERAVAVGDGYTDIPMLDWAETAVLVDRSGKKRKRYKGKNYGLFLLFPKL